MDLLYKIMQMRIFSDMKYYLILILLVLSSCHSRYPPDKPQYDMKASLERKNVHRLSHLGFRSIMNGGGDIGPLQRIAAGFQTNKYRFTSIESARAFFCGFVKDYIKPFNEDKEIRPYLRHFPMTAENFRLCLQFVDDRGRQLEPPYIGSIWLNQGYLFYFEDTPNAKKAFQEIYREPFAEAERQV